MITINPQRSEFLTSRLIAIWNASVKASHHFLGDDDISNLTPFVKSGIEQVNTLVVYSINEQPIGFMGIEGMKIEMLFVSPNYFDKGIGRKLMDVALKQYNVKYVDVNEQNTSGIGFYKHLGFEVFERQDIDEQGNSFPILNLRIGHKNH